MNTRFAEFKRSYRELTGVWLATTGVPILVIGLAWVLVGGEQMSATDVGMIALTFVSVILLIGCFVWAAKIYEKVPGRDERIANRIGVSCFVRIRLESRSTLRLSSL